jgi:hypothetical protein
LCDAKLAVLAGVAPDVLQNNLFQVSVLRGDAAIFVYDLSVRSGLRDHPTVFRSFWRDPLAGEAIEQAIDAAPAPTCCPRLDNNILPNFQVLLQCLDQRAMATLVPPAWPQIPNQSVSEIVHLNSDVDAGVVVGPSFRDPMMHVCEEQCESDQVPARSMRCVGRVIPTGIALIGIWNGRST